MSGFYERAEDIPADEREELREGIALLGRKLREWREFGCLHSLRAELLNADGTITLVCNPDDSVTLIDGDTTLDVTELL